MSGIEDMMNYGIHRMNELEDRISSLKEQNQHKDAEIARLKREVEHRLDEMNLQARWTREAQAKVASLRAALRPFAEFARKFDAAPITNVERADVLYGIHGGSRFENGADLRLSDCRAAQKALGDEP